MKRTLSLTAALIALVLLWGGLHLRATQEAQFLRSADRAQLDLFVRDHPDHPEGLRRLGQMQCAVGEMEAGLPNLRKAMEAGPDDGQNWVALARALPDDREALRVLEDYLKQDPTSGAALGERARRLLALGDIGGAQRAGEQATKAAGGSADAWRCYGEVLLAVRRLPDAQSAFRRALALRDEPEIRVALARALVPLQRYAEIVALCAPALTDKATVGTVRARALLYSAGGQLFAPQTDSELVTVQERLRDADRLSSALPPDERFLPSYFLGESFLRRGQPKEAIAPLERAVADGPMFPGSLYSLARAYRLAGEGKKADAAFARHARQSAAMGQIERWSSRLEHKPDDPDALRGLADALVQIGNRPEAERLYRRLNARNRGEGLSARQ